MFRSLCITWVPFDIAFNCCPSTGFLSVCRMLRKQLVVWLLLLLLLTNCRLPEKEKTGWQWNEHDQNWWLVIESACADVYFGTVIHPNAICLPVMSHYHTHTHKLLDNCRQWVGAFDWTTFLMWEKVLCQPHFRSLDQQTFAQILLCLYVLPVWAVFSFW